eukprot:654742-Rhodomonas_salina.2
MGIGERINDLFQITVLVTYAFVKGRAHCWHPRLMPNRSLNFRGSHSETRKSQSRTLSTKFLRAVMVSSPQRSVRCQRRWHMA